ncbi:MAG: glycerate kinase [Clostridia bacterium]|nr:glycerate kinase [Clostridia bacterium]
MHIIVAPDKFKGSMSALEAANHIACGVKAIFPNAQINIFPLSDGGEGLVESLVGSLRGSFETAIVTGPLGSPVKACWGIIDDGKTAVIEMAAASGLALVSEKLKDPAVTTTYGTGELIRTALDQGCSKLIVGIGGSATNDGGAGMAQALGAGLFDQSGHPLGYGGAELLRLDRIEVSGLDSRLDKVKTLVACDVDNPLIGPEGAAYVYGPQKGASPKIAGQLDKALDNYARVIKRDLGVDVAFVAGAGAAGGLGAGLITFLQAELSSGIELVLDALEIDQSLQDCQLLITGEGKLDTQSAHGKAPVGVARRARKYKVPVIALTGMIEGDLNVFHREGISACFAIANGPLSLEESISKGPQLLENKTAELMRLWKLCMNKDSISDL